MLAGIAVLADWGASDRAALIAALADLRQFEAASLVLSCGRDTPAASSRAREILAYTRFVRRVSTSVDSVYQRIAAGDSITVNDIRSTILAAAGALWPALAWDGAPPVVSEETVRAALADRFGLYYSLGLTSGYPSLHMGHTVVDDRRVITDLEKTATVRFVSLDAMVSNGFQTWAWRGRASTGGWANAEAIVQVRSSYADGPLSAWSLVISRDRTAASIAADSAADFQAARRQPVGYFPSVPARLLRDGRDAIVDSLTRAGFTGKDLEAAFKREYARAELESSVFAHETRHAIDQLRGDDLSSEELEFRAKLSQVALAPWPRIAAVGGIFQANIGDGSPHGEANRRIMEGLLAWLTANLARLPSINPEDPLLPQVPSLSAEQLREAFASMDPDKPDASHGGASMSSRSGDQS
jgi:hypothetical protein